MAIRVKKTTETKPAPVATKSERPAALKNKPDNGPVVMKGFGERRKLLVDGPVIGNYVQFVNTKSKNRDDICDKLNVKSKNMIDDFPIVMVAGKPTLLEPFAYIPTEQWFQHFSIMTETYEITESYIDVDEKPGQDFDDCIETVIIVVTGKGELIPACCLFKNTKTRAFSDVMTYISEQQEKAQGNGAYDSVLATVTLTEYTSKSTRREMMIGSAECEECPNDIRKALADAFKTPEFLQQLKDCVKANSARYELVKSKANN